MKGSELFPNTNGAEKVKMVKIIKHTQKQTNNIDGVIYEILNFFYIYMVMIGTMVIRTEMESAGQVRILFAFVTHCYYRFYNLTRIQCYSTRKDLSGDPLDITKIELLNTMTDKSPFNPSQISF